MRQNFVFCFLLAGLQLICIQASKHHASQESQTAYAVFDENSEEFVIVNTEPPRDKYVAGARFTNSINQTGYAFYHLPYMLK